MIIIAILAIILGLSKIAMVFSRNSETKVTISDNFPIDAEKITNLLCGIIGIDGLIEILLGVFILL